MGPSSTSQLRKRKASQDLITNPLNKELKFANDEPSLPPIPEPIDENAERAKKKQNVITRTIWTLIMIVGFIGSWGNLTALTLKCADARRTEGILLLGHAWVAVLVFVCQTLAYREVTALFQLTHPQRGAEVHDAWDSTLNWYFFAITNYFLYGESIIYYFKVCSLEKFAFVVDGFISTFRSISSFQTHNSYHSLRTIVSSVSCYTPSVRDSASGNAALLDGSYEGFVGFVASLKRQYLKYQFGLFGWVHMSLLVLVLSRWLDHMRLHHLILISLV